MAQTRETKTVAHPAMLAVGLDPCVMIWKQPVGLFRALTDPDRKVMVGTPGQSDAIAVVKVQITPDMVGKTIGVAVAPEFKTKTGKHAENQKDWRRAFEARGGIYRLVRSAADMLRLIEEVKNGQAFR
jgi:hypothetical protein